MQHTPKTAWESVKVLAGGMSSHHKAPTVMRFKLPNGNLAATDAENASILGPHFERVYTNHQKIDWAVLDEILQRLTMLELDAEVTWEELKKAVTELANRKSPGLNEVSPDAFKPSQNKTYLSFSISSMRSGTRKPTLTNGMKDRWYLYQKVATSVIPTSGAGSHLWTSVRKYLVRSCGRDCFTSSKRTRLNTNLARHQEYGVKTVVSQLRRCCTYAKITTYPRGSCLQT